MLSSNVQGSASHRAVEGGEAPLHVQRKAGQQQLVHDLVVAMPSSQVPWGHALSVIP